MAKARHWLKFTRLEFMTLLQCPGRLAAPGAGAAVEHCTSADNTAAQAGHGSKQIPAAALQHSAWHMDLACSWCQLTHQAERHRGLGAAGAVVENKPPEAFITMQQDKPLGRLLQHFQHSPDDFFLTLELLGIAGGTVLSTRGLTSQVLWPATPDKGSPMGAQK